ncbi:keratin-associated protein 16-3 [Drosophila innubila]|uniref:keratin-associated protein 16-3 n=1 Tax=Drosophila innubila TaxID=198719 RepID=UPI00148E645D|nr:keratin-associated protein 16-3 [Drosophila innubila]
MQVYLVFCILSCLAISCLSAPQWPGYGSGGYGLAPWGGYGNYASSSASASATASSGSFGYGHGHRNPGYGIGWPGYGGGLGGGYGGGYHQQYNHYQYNRYGQYGYGYPFGYGK